MCVCSVCVYVCVCACLCAFACMRMCLCKCMFVSAIKCLYMFVCLHFCGCACVFTCTCVHACSEGRLDRIASHVYIHMYLSPSFIVCLFLLFLAHFFFYLSLSHTHSLSCSFSPFLLCLLFPLSHLGIWIHCV